MATEISYKGAVIAAPEVGQTATLKCKGMLMADDVVVNCEAAEEWFNDGNTHIWVALFEGLTSPRLGAGVNGTVTVDWGDGTTPDILTGTDTSTMVFTPTHNYASAGDYIITLTVDGEMVILGGPGRGACILSSNSLYHARNNSYRNTIRKIEIGYGMTSIGTYAFSGFYGLLSINLPDSLTSIGNNAFQSCYGLSSINIPDSVTSIGDSAFYGCSGLSSINLPDSVASIGDSAFYGCSGLSSINLPDSLTSINYASVQSCTGLLSINIPDGVTSIGIYAFSGCYGLLSINLPDSLTSIGAHAFGWCGGLVSINIPDNVTSIGDYVLMNCNALSKIHFEGATPPTATEYAFDSLPNDCVISVPVGSLEAYKTATNYPDPAVYTYIEE